MDLAFHNLKVQKKKFLILVEKNFGPQDRKKIQAAFEFAQVKHQGQRRAEGTAYFIHPVRVAITLIQDVGTWDADVVAAGLLHDVVEDCRVHLLTIAKRFGKRVAQFVEALTRRRSKQETEVEKERHKLEKLTKLQRQPLEVRMVKCADILDNLRSASDVPFWAWTKLARKKFPRWHREFHVASEFAKGVHPVLYREIQKALRMFDLKRVMRGMVRLGF